ncbi:hypothetical protein FKM82_029642 [Ascaphus truei]
MGHQRNHEGAVRWDTPPCTDSPGISLARWDRPGRAGRRPERRPRSLPMTTAPSSLVEETGSSQISSPLCAFPCGCRNDPAQRGHERP